MSTLGNLLNGGRKLYPDNPMANLAEELRLLLKAHYRAIPTPGSHEDALDVYFMPTFPQPMTASAAMEKILNTLRQYDKSVQVAGPRMLDHGIRQWRVYHGHRSFHFIFMPRVQDMATVQRGSSEYVQEHKAERARKNLGKELRNLDIFNLVVEHGDNIETMRQLATSYGINPISARAIWMRKLGDWNRPRKIKRLPIVVLNPRASRSPLRYRVYTADTRYTECRSGEHRNDQNMTIQQAMSLAKRNDDLN